MKTNLSYRIIQERDLAEICKLPQNADELFFMFPKAEYPLTVTQLKKTLTNRFDSTVILQDKMLVGFANFYEVEDNNYCSIGNVIVKADFRNQGIGIFLIKTMENIALQKYKVSEYRLSCFNTNTNGILLYSKLGYQPFDIEKRDNKYRESLALIKMRKQI